MVWLFTKEGCPKTAPVVELLSSLRADYPHDLEAVDICDDENRATWFSMYQDDLPVLHMDDDYWAKNGDLTESEARSAFEEFRSGNFKARKGEPDADGGDGMEAAMHVGRA
jgi:glutaredoxin-related protein